jgi:hypothetical protein
LFFAVINPTTQCLAKKLFADKPKFQYVLKGFCINKYYLWPFWICCKPDLTTTTSRPFDWWPPSPRTSAEWCVASKGRSVGCRCPRWSPSLRHRPEMECRLTKCPKLCLKKSLNYKVGKIVLGQPGLVYKRLKVTSFENKNLSTIRLLSLRYSSLRKEIESVVSV